MRANHFPGVVAVVVVGLMSVGCVVVVHDDRPAPPPPQQIVAVPTPAPEPVQQVIYEPPPREVVVVYERDLGAYGHWVLIEPYGRCWVWDRRPYGWRPYTVGHWVATPDGWLWVAEGEEASWGATCFHYGRWYLDPFNGWVWVPGRVWAPSWCAWREGPEHTCWAPLPPDCGDGHLISVTVVDQRIPPANYVVVETRYVTNVHVVQNIIVNNTVIVNKTVNITNITYVNGRAINRGVDVAHVQRATGHPVKTVTATTVTDIEQARQLQAMGRPVVYAPPAITSYAKQHPIQPRKAIPARHDDSHQPSNTPKVTPDHHDNPPKHVEADDHRVTTPGNSDHPIQPAKEDHHVTPENRSTPGVTEEEHKKTPPHKNPPQGETNPEHRSTPNGAEEEHKKTAPHKNPPQGEANPEHRSTPNGAEEEHKKTAPHKNPPQGEANPEHRNTANPRTENPSAESKQHPAEKNPKETRKPKEEEPPK